MIKEGLKRGQIDVEDVGWRLNNVGRRNLGGVSLPDLNEFLFGSNPGA